jgi:cytochrome c oxidase subunit II
VSRAGSGAICACIGLAALSGCGSSSTTQTTTGSSTPAFAVAPYTPQQQRVQQGAKLVVSDGCSACHLNGANPRLAPAFTRLAGHHVRLKDGRTALVDEGFLREALLDPARTEVAGYDPAPMIAALRRLHLQSRPAEVAALVAFIEQVGPETE